MIFPHNIEGIVKNSKKSSTKDKTLFGLVILAMVNGYLFIMVAPSLKEGYGIPITITVLVILLLNLVIGSTLFRVFILKEKDQLKEFENSKDDSLSRYYFIRERETPKIVEDIEVFEHVDGNFFFVLQIFLGPNDMEKSEGTHRFFSNLFNVLTSYCIDFRTYVCKEQFSESIECKRFLNGLGRSGNPELTKAMLEISDAVLDFTEKNGQLYSIYLPIRVTPFQLTGIKAFKSELSALLSNDIHSIRNFKFLNKKEFRDFIRDYYNVEALDLSNIRNPQVSAQLMRTYGKNICPVNEYDYRFNTGVKFND